MTIHIHPGPAPIAGDADRLDLQEFVRIRAAALHARRTYPGPLGELVQRELTAYAEFGYRFIADALIPRLVTELLAPEPIAPNPSPPTPRRTRPVPSTYHRTPVAAHLHTRGVSPRSSRKGAGHDLPPVPGPRTDSR